MAAASSSLPPRSFADRAGVQVGATATGNVLSNDKDPISGDTLAVTAVDGQANDVGNDVVGAFGSLTLSSDGSFSYKTNVNDVLPASGFGEDVFTYTASTGGAASIPDGNGHACWF